jgi:hypothetical protein
MPILELSYVENLILEADITGISTDLLLIELDGKEDKADACKSVGLMNNSNSNSTYLPENSANASKEKIIIVTIFKKYGLNVRFSMLGHILFFGIKSLLNSLHN